MSTLDPWTLAPGVRVHTVDGPGTVVGQEWLVRNVWKVTVKRDDGMTKDYRSDKLLESNPKKRLAWVKWRHKLLLLVRKDLDMTVEDTILTAYLQDLESRLDLDFRQMWEDGASPLDAYKAILAGLNEQRAPEPEQEDEGNGNGHGLTAAYIGPIPRFQYDAQSGGKKARGWDQDRERHLQMMASPEKWPRGDVLPLKNINREFLAVDSMGVMIADIPPAQFTVFLSDLFSFGAKVDAANTLSELPHEAYSSYLAIYNAGWRVD